MRLIISSTIVGFLITNSVLCETHQDQNQHEDSLKLNPAYSGTRNRILNQLPQDVLKFLETLSHLRRTTMFKENYLADTSNWNDLTSINSELMVKRDQLSYYKCYLNPVSCFRK
ncbi:uncharacterized protein LOC107266587 [Cephus cinctus]|uniref:Uncharacterized protein LOC107266587 n=1 Tax=Cephus cinctus TaxID=211228 RepID=A0AAJ7FHY0_CEPCN|nr:uncharacterized protein LOC107266587 [Cephus cinctus]